MRNRFQEPVRQLRSPRPSQPLRLSAGMVALEELQDPEELLVVQKQCQVEEEEDRATDPLDDHMTPLQLPRPPRIDEVRFR